MSVTITDDVGGPAWPPGPEESEGSKWGLSAFPFFWEAPAFSSSPYLNLLESKTIRYCLSKGSCRVWEKIVIGMWKTGPRNTSQLSALIVWISAAGKTFGIRILKHGAVSIRFFLQEADMDTKRITIWTVEIHFLFSFPIRLTVDQTGNEAKLLDYMKMVKQELTDMEAHMPNKAPKDLNGESPTKFVQEAKEMKGVLVSESKAVTGVMHQVGNSNNQCYRAV
jgi:hypothetical protein